MELSSNQKLTLKFIVAILVAASVATYISKVGFTFDLRTFVSVLIGAVAGIGAAIVVSMILNRPKK